MADRVASAEVPKRPVGRYIVGLAVIAIAAVVSTILTSTALTRQGMDAVMPRQRDPEPDPAGSRPTKVVLEPEAAAELADLLADAPGEADEDVLDDALDALRDRTTRIPGHQQREVGAG